MIGGIIRVQWKCIMILSCQNNKVVAIKKSNKVVCAIVHKFAYIKTIECNNVLSSSIGFACSFWNSVKRYDLVALSKIHVCNKVVTMIRPCCTEQNPGLQQGRQLWSHLVALMRCYALVNVFLIYIVNIHLFFSYYFPQWVHQRSMA